jgi:hypothetical protein
MAKETFSLPDEDMEILLLKVKRVFEDQQSKPLTKAAFWREFIKSHPEFIKAKKQ